jgi:hypothetical protein
MTDPVPRTGPTRAFNRMARKLRSDFFVRFPFRYNISGM